MNEYIVLINYKKFDVLVKEIKNKYQVGIKSEKGLEMWLKDGTYENFNLARTSGKEYACIMIDKIYTSRKE